MSEIKLQENIVGMGCLNETLKIRFGEKKKVGSGNIKFLNHCKIKYNYKDGNGFLVDATDVMEALLPEGKTKLTSFDIKLPSNNINSFFRSQYKKKIGNKVVGKSDGVTWLELQGNEWKEVSDPGEKALANYKGLDGWKCTLWLYVMIPEFNDFGTVACLRTTSYNNWKTLKQQLETFSQVTKKQLTEITFKFRVRQGFTANGPYAHGSIEYPGGVLDLAKNAAEVKKQFKELGLDKIQEQIDKEIALSIDSIQDSDQDVFEQDDEEFYPENNSNKGSDIDLTNNDKPDKELKKLDEKSKVVKKETISVKKTKQISEYLEKDHGLSKEQRIAYYKRFGTVKDDVFVDKLPEIEENVLKFKKDVLVTFINGILSKRNDIKLSKEFVSIKDKATIEDLKLFHKEKLL